MTTGDGKPATPSTAKPAPPAPPFAERSAKALELIAAEARRIADVLERLSPPPPLLVNLDDGKSNPTVRFDPRSWKGPTMKGKLFSLCPADYLEQLAAAFDAMGSTASDPRERHFKRLDSARARGWAERIRAGWKPRTLGTAQPPKPAPNAPPRPDGAGSTPVSSTSSKPTDYPADWDDAEDDDDLAVK